MIEFELYNDVGVEGGITLDSVKNFLNANKNQEIKFKVATLGGDLAQAITIHNLIKSHPKKTVAEIVGLTASAGTVIALACNEVIMYDNALFLIHNGWTSVTGNAEDMSKMASDLMKNDALMVKIYREKTGLEDKKIKDLMAASDWLSSGEAKEFGFIDSVITSTQKIAASAIIQQAQEKNINSQLLIKLKDKMKIFGKDKKDVPVVNILALKDGKNLLINAEEVSTGVEVAPVNAATLDDGEYELVDGKKITVAGGVITNVTEPMAAGGEPQAETEAIVAAVTEVVTAEIAKVKTEIQAEIKTELAKISSQHIPPSGENSDPKPGPARSPQAKVKEVTDKIREGIEKSRKA